MPGRDIENDLKQVAESLVLADMMFRKGRIIEAEPMYEKTLAMLIRTYAEAHPDVDACLLRLSDIYFSREKFAQALSAYSRLYNVRCSTKGVHHLDTLSISFKIAKTNEKLERFGEAAQIYEAAIADGEQFLGAGNLLVGSMLESYGLLLRRHLNNPQRAAEIEQRAKECRKKVGSKTSLIRPRMPDHLPSPEAESVNQNAVVPSPISTKENAQNLEEVRLQAPLIKPKSTQSGVTSTQSGLASTQSGLASTQSGVTSTQSGVTSTQSGLASMQGGTPAPRKALSAFVDSKSGLNDLDGSGFGMSRIVEVNDKQSGSEPKTVFTSPIELVQKLPTAKSPFVGTGDASKPYVSGTPYIAAGLRHRNDPPYNANNVADPGTGTDSRLGRANESFDKNDAQVDEQNAPLDEENAPLDEEEYYDDDEFDEERPKSKNFLWIAFVVLIALIVPIFIGWSMMNNHDQSFLSHPNTQPASFGATTIPIQENSDGGLQSVPLRAEPAETPSAPKPALRRGH